METLTRSGEWFRENFPVTPPTAVTALTDYREKDRKTVWYNSRYYRTNLLWEGGALCIRDIHMFDQRMESDYYRKAGTTNQCVYTTLPVVDGCMWSTREQLAGLRVVRRNADGSLAQAHGGTPAVTEKSKGKLLVEWPMDDGRKLTILLSEEGMEIAVSGKGPDWMLELTAAPGAALPFTAFGARRIAAVQKGFAYAFDCTKGTIATDGTSTGSIFVLHPSDGKISLKFK